MHRDDGQRGNSIRIGRVASRDGDGLRSRNESMCDDLAVFVPNGDGIRVVSRDRVVTSRNVLSRRRGPHLRISGHHCRTMPSVVRLDGSGHVASGALPRRRLGPVRGCAAVDGGPSFARRFGRGTKRTWAASVAAVSVASPHVSHHSEAQLSRVGRPPNEAASSQQSASGGGAAGAGGPAWLLVGEDTSDRRTVTSRSGAMGATGRNGFAFSSSIQSMVADYRRHIEEHFRAQELLETLPEARVPFVAVSDLAAPTPSSAERLLERLRLLIARNVRWPIHDAASSLLATLDDEGVMERRAPSTATTQATTSGLRNSAAVTSSSAPAVSLPAVRPFTIVLLHPSLLTMEWGATTTSISPSSSSSASSSAAARPIVAGDEGEASLFFRRGLGSEFNSTVTLQLRHVASHYIMLRSRILHWEAAVRRATLCQRDVAESCCFPWLDLGAVCDVVPTGHAPSRYPYLCPEVVADVGCPVVMTADIASPGQTTTTTTAADVAAQLHRLLQHLFHPRADLWSIAVIALEWAILGCGTYIEEGGKRTENGSRNAGGHRARAVDAAARGTTLWRRAQQLFEPTTGATAEAHPPTSTTTTTSSPPRNAEAAVQHDRSPLSLASAVLQLPPPSPAVRRCYRVLHAVGGHLRRHLRAATTPAVTTTHNEPPNQPGDVMGADDDDDDDVRLARDIAGFLTGEPNDVPDDDHGNDDDSGFQGRVGRRSGPRRFSVDFLTMLADWLDVNEARRAASGSTQELFTNAAASESIRTGRAHGSPAAPDHFLGFSDVIPPTHARQHQQAGDTDRASATSMTRTSTASAQGNHDSHNDTLLPPPSQRPFPLHSSNLFGQCQEAYFVWRQAADRYLTNDGGGAGSKMARHGACSTAIVDFVLTLSAAQSVGALFSLAPT